MQNTFGKKYPEFLYSLVNDKLDKNLTRSTKSSLKEQNYHNLAMRIIVETRNKSPKVTEQILTADTILLAIRTLQST